MANTNTPIRLKRASQRSVIPKGAKFVGRPSKLGNQFEGEMTQELAVLRHREWAIRERQANPQVFEPLRGLDLMCYCEPDQPCHADTLIELANAARVNSP